MTVVSLFERRCAQCWKPKPFPRAFVSPNTGIVTTWCTDCRKLYDGGGRRASRRADIDRGSLRVLCVAKSMNRKLGKIPATLTSGITCPDACALKDAGCFAEFGFGGAHWKKVPERGNDWEGFICWVLALPFGTLWRHNIAGDLPGDGDTLDVTRFVDLVVANRLKRGFTYTHKPLATGEERAAVTFANEMGFTVNLSADGVEDADRKADLGIAPVVVVVPSDAPDRFRTPAGRHVVVCPAERVEGMTCERCKLCAVSHRRSIVAFRAHGQYRARVDKTVRLRRK